MKKYFSFLMFAFLLAAGCSESENSTATEGKQEGDSFVFNEGTYLTPSVDSDGGVLTFGFKSNTDWSVTEEADWVEVEPASGDATANKFEVVVDKNDSGRAREAVLTVAYGERNIAITLTQNADICAENEITYRTTTGETIELNSYEGFGGNLIDNTYADGYGKIRFDGEVTTIPAEAFKGCKNLSFIILPDNLQNIGNSAFEGCSSLGSIALGAKVTSVGERAFYECRSLQSATLGEAVTAIGAEAFYRCSQLESIAIPTGVKSLNDKTFYDCTSLAEVTLAEGVESIGDHCFTLCSSLNNITLPESLTSVDAFAFNDCAALATVIFGNNIESLGNNAFAGCGALTNVTLPDSLKSIGDSTFINCKSIFNITIPASTESIGDFAFFNCAALYSVECLVDNVPSLGKQAFHKHNFEDLDEDNEVGNPTELSYIPIGSQIYVPAAAVETYKGATNWSDYAAYIKAK